MSEDNQENRGKMATLCLSGIVDSVTIAPVFVNVKRHELWFGDCIMWNV
jgi:hypothetical protein